MNQNLGRTDRGCRHGEEGPPAPSPAKSPPSSFAIVRNEAAAGNQMLDLSMKMRGINIWVAEFTQEKKNTTTKKRNASKLKC